MKKEEETGRYRYIYKKTQKKPTYMIKQNEKYLSPSLFLLLSSLIPLLSLLSLTLHFLCSGFKSHKNLVFQNIAERGRDLVCVCVREREREGRQAR
jgi:hypothetical protein